MVEILTLHLSNLIEIQTAHPLPAAPVEFDVMHITLGVNELVGMHTEAIHFAIAGWGAEVGVDLSQHMGRGRILAHEVKHTVRVLNIVDR